MTYLTKGRLEAIAEALDHSLSMRQDSALSSRAEYERARDWAIEEIRKRDGKLARRAPTNPIEPRQYLGK